MATPEPRDILCIGSVLWDVIGRAASHMRQGSDVPGRITRLPGGVAMNIARTLARFAMRPVLLSAIGRDAEGEEEERPHHREEAPHRELLLDLMRKSFDATTYAHPPVPARVSSF